LGACLPLLGCVCRTIHYVDDSQTAPQVKGRSFQRLGGSLSCNTCNFIQKTTPDFHLAYIPKFLS